MKVTFNISFIHIKPFDNLITHFIHIKYNASYSKEMNNINTYIVNNV